MSKVYQIDNFDCTVTEWHSRDGIRTFISMRSVGKVITLHERNHKNNMETARKRFAKLEAMLASGKTQF